MVRRVVVLALLLAAGCGGHDKSGAAVTAGAPTIEIAVRDGSTRHLSAYNEALARNARAPVRVKARTGWRAQEPNPEAAMIADVRSGRLAFGLVSARVFDTLGVDAFAPLMAPFAIDSLDAQQRVLASDLPGRALPALSRLGVVGVAALPGDLRHPLGLTRPLVTPASFRGARIGVRASSLAQRAFEQLGATTAYSVRDEFSGFDGIESDLASIEGVRADSGAVTLAADLVLWPRVLVLVANPAAWERLGESRRAALRDAARVSLPAAIEDLRARDAEAYDVLCRRGDVAFARTTPGDAAALRRAFAPAARGLDGAALAEIERLRAGAATPAPHPPCHPPARTQPGPATAIDGVWTFDSVPADLRAIGAPEEELILPDNWGHHVLAFSRGAFAIAQEGEQSCEWVYGTYRVSGHRMFWEVTDGGGYSAAGAFNHPGEHFQYTWSRFKDTLRATLVPPGARNFISKPWRRIGNDPRRAPFPRRCPPPPKALQF